MKSLARKLVPALILSTASTLLFAQSPEKSVTNQEAEAIFQILASDIAAQRGYGEVSAATMLSLARQRQDPVLARRAFEFAAQTKDFITAFEATLLWQALSPNDELAKKMLTELTNYLGQADNLGQVLNQRLLQSNDIAEELFHVQITLLNLEPRNLALTHIDSTFANLDDNSLALATKALIYFSNGEKKQALETTQKAIQLDPNNELAATLQLQILGESDPQQGISLTQHFLQTSTNDNNSLKALLGRVYIQQKQIPAAMEIIQSIRQTDPNSVEALYLQGLVNYSEGNLEAAKKQFQTVLKQRPTPVFGSIIRPSFVQQLIFDILKRQKKYDEARNYLTTLEENSFTKNLQLAYLNIAAKQLTKAQQVITKLSPTSEQEIKELAELEFVMVINRYKDPKQQTQQFKQLLSRFPKVADLYLMITSELDKQKQYKTMEEILRTMVVMFPDSAVAYNTLGYTLLTRTDQLDEAVSFISKAYQLEPSNPAIQDSMAWAYYQSGKPQEAVALLTEVFKTLKDAEVAAHLGEALWSLGQKEEAQAIWKEGLSINNKNDVLLETIKRLQSTKP